MRLVGLLLAYLALALAFAQLPLRARRTAWSAVPSFLAVAAAWACLVLIPGAYATP